MLKDNAYFVSIYIFTQNNCTVKSKQTRSNKNNEFPYVNDVEPKTIINI